MPRERVIDGLSGSEDLVEVTRRLRDWMFAESLPLWGSAGIHASGGVYEALDFEGRAIESDETRVRVQARQAFSFALAHRLGFEPDATRRRIEHQLETVTGACRRADGLYGRRVNLRERRLVDDTADLYDCAFVLLGLATARGVSGFDVDPHVDALLDALDAKLARDGGYAEFLPLPSYRMQNPHMHLFESLLALYETTGDAAVRERIDTLYAFIAGRFFNETQHCIDEYADPADASQTGYFEPGHSLEWTWLLGRHARLTGSAYPAFGRRLYERALRTLDESGRACMRVAHDGTPIDASRRLWLQTETVKAHLSIMEHTDGTASSDARSRAIQSAAGMLDEWLAPAVAGGWLDHFGADDRVLATDMPASSGYHVYGAVAELMRCARID